MIFGSEYSEVIVKFSGNIYDAVSSLGAFAEIIDCNYAVVTILTSRIPELYNFREVEYYEPAKTIMAVSAMRNELGITGISPVKESVYRLNGAGVLVGIIDSGIDYTHEDFRNENGTTRIYYIWDQSIDGTPPDGFLSGTEYSRRDIDRALASDDPFSIVPSRDIAGHGTAVAGIAAGKNGVASKSDIIAVKLGNSDATVTTDILRAVKYLTDKATELNMPLSINLSYGMNFGSHSGDSLFERCLDSMCGKWKISFSAAMGNEGGAGHHFSTVTESGKSVTAEFVCLALSGALFLYIRKSFSNDIELELIAPNGVSSGILYQNDRVKTIRYGTMSVVMDFRQITHYSLKQEIIFSFGGNPANFIPGIWKLRIRCLSVIDGRIDIWLPTTEEVGTNTAFLYPDEYFTLTIPATVPKIISVGGYNSALGSLAYFSGKGFGDIAKPDIAAPAVDIYTARAGGGYDAYTGTSMASPFVCGAAAIMMEWGIVNGLSPFLYGEMIKAYLQKGAKRNVNIKYPDDGWGYGVLDLRRTMEILEYNL